MAEQAQKKHEVLKGLIVIEGPEGAGKTSAVQALRDLAAKRGISGVAFRKEPTMKPPAGVGSNWFEEDRREHLVQYLRPACALGDTVILDRYQPSTMVNQMSEWPTDIPMPELCLFILPAIETLTERANARVAAGTASDLDRPEHCKRQLELYRKVAAWMSKHTAVVIFVPDASVTPERTAEVLLNYIQASPLEREALNVFWSGRGPTFGAGK